MRKPLLAARTAITMVDVAPSDSALGDQLIGTGDLTTPAGRELGTSSFVGVSTCAKPRTATTGPVFDETFAITGGATFTVQH